MMDGQASVPGQPDVQFDTVGTQPAGSEEGGHGVLSDPGGRVRAASVGLHGRDRH
jgi:hypothetical protein